MNKIIGIRREDKNRWERRTPLIPKHLNELKEKHGINSIVQTSPIRVFSDDDYKKNGLSVKEDLSDCDVVFGVKEMPLDFFKSGTTYVFFSHTVKGQEYNMPMLKKMMDVQCNLIDYERITDDKGKRLLFFGRYAGLAGMVDALWAFGKRVDSQGLKNPFNEIKQTMEYKSLDEIKEHFKKIGDNIKQKGIPETLAPMIIGLAGYGNVSHGAQEILDFLPVKQIRPNQLEAIVENYSDKVIYKVVFKEEDMVEPISTEANFDLNDYYKNPHFYRSVFEGYIRRLSILMNCIYWDERYPRLITKEFLEENYTGQMKLQVVGDISVDINGAIEFTEKYTTPDDPVFVYNPVRDDIIEGYKGSGVAVIAIDNLPCELPKESSQAFSNALLPFVADIAQADYSIDFDKLNLPSEIKKAVVLYHGKLTPTYSYINKFL